MSVGVNIQILVETKSVFKNGFLFAKPRQSIPKMKVLYNTSYGGFRFSEEFVEEYNKRYPDSKIPTWAYNLSRTEPNAIALFEEKGSDWSSNMCSKIAVEEIPDDVEYRIDEYDGMEAVIWDIPKDQIIEDLMDIVKGRKKLENTSKFTQMMLQSDLRPYQLRKKLTSSS